MSQESLHPQEIALIRRCKNALKNVWEGFDHTVLSNQAKVLDAFVQKRVSLAHMSPSTGYGYGDTGREGLDSVYSRVFEGESALVRVHWASGTHVMKTALFALLRPGDEVLSVTGTPYDTLHPVIGFGQGNDSGPRGTSLGAYGISYAQTDALSDYQKGSISAEQLEGCLSRAVTPNTKVFMVQRSRGYSQKSTISMKTLEVFMATAQRRWPHVLTFVDNCYCEFVEEREPPGLGVTLTAGSLTKNPGGGLAPTGGYLVGKSWAVAAASETLYATGIGREVGCNAAGYRLLYQGLFAAPKVVGEALKGAAFAAMFFQELGYPVDPLPLDARSDIVQSITMGSGEGLRTLARAVQYASPVDSFATPEPWDMPGYGRQVIMAAGTFVQGSSIELSCDGPFAPPYIAYLQGGLTCEHVILACLNAKKMLVR